MIKDTSNYKLYCAINTGQEDSKVLYCREIGGEISMSKKKSIVNKKGNAPRTSGTFIKHVKSGAKKLRGNLIIKK